MSDLRRDRLPETSSIWTCYTEGDFIDGYSITSTLTPRQAAETGLALPGWAQALMGLRNALVRPFGLKTGAGEGAKGQGMFPVLKDDDHEFVLGLDDRHLDFRIIVLREGGRVFMSTWVRPHNLAGRAYLRLVMPFHVLITRGAVARMAR